MTCAVRGVQQELGKPVTSVFSSISAGPVAAASLGQVYRATLRDGGADVAVKVQRPGVLELVALDLVIGRKGIEVAGALFPELVRGPDILPVLDEWAFKLYREMDYRREAVMMQRFEEDMSELQGIMIPKVRAVLRVLRAVLRLCCNHQGEEAGCAAGTRAQHDNSVVKTGHPQATASIPRCLCV